jgi:hypothetical protein
MLKKSRKLLDWGGSNNNLGDGPRRCLSRCQRRWLCACGRHRRQPWPSPVAGGLGSMLPPDQNHSTRISRPTKRVATGGRGELGWGMKVPHDLSASSAISSPTLQCLPLEEIGRERSWRRGVCSGHFVPCGALGCPPWVHSGPPIFCSIGNSDDTKTDGWVMGLWELWVGLSTCFLLVLLGRLWGWGFSSALVLGFFSVSNFLRVRG